MPRKEIFMALDKESLEKLGVSAEAVTQILADHQSALQDEQQKTAQEKARADTAENTLSTANKKLEGYDPDWKSAVKNAETKAQQEIETMKFNYALEKALSDSKAKNAVAVKALLNMDGLKQNGNEIVGLKEQLEKLKNDSDYLFESEPDPKPFTASATGSGSQPTTTKDEANAAFRAVFGRE